MSSTHSPNRSLPLSSAKSSFLGSPPPSLPSSPPFLFLANNPIPSIIRRRNYTPSLFFHQPNEPISNEPTTVQFTGSLVRTSSGRTSIPHVPLSSPPLPVLPPPPNSTPKSRVIERRPRPLPRNAEPPCFSPPHRPTVPAIVAAISRIWEGGGRGASSTPLALPNDGPTLTAPR